MQLYDGAVCTATIKEIKSRTDVRINIVNQMWGIVNHVS